MDTVPLRDAAAALHGVEWQSRGVVVAIPRRVRWRGILAAAIIAVVIAGIVADRWLRVTTLASLPAAPAPASGLFAVPVPLTIMVSAAGQRGPWVTNEDEVRDNVELWKRMHLEDWNEVAEPLRSAGLDHMLKRYAGIINTPAVWDRMTVFDWDAVPQPIRTVAYRRMVAYWSGFYHLGPEFGLPPGAVADTLAAMVMSESWFDHRARSLNRDGTWDVGLSQASCFARERLRELRARGAVDVDFSDDDFIDPWKATRFLALWMKLMLAENNGDLERAVRAYNRGTADAMDTIGAGYWATVQGRLTRFIRNADAPPSWDYVWRASRPIVAAQS